MISTNLTAFIVSLLLTNVSERIDQPSYAITNLQAFDGQRWSIPNPSPPTKRITTEVYDQRLLILEAEGITFTNVLSSVRKVRKEEVYSQVVPPPQWVIQPDRAYIDTNPPANVFATNGIAFGIINVTNPLALTTNYLLYSTPSPSK